MTTNFKYYVLIGLAFSLMKVNHVVGQNSDAMKNSQATKTLTKVWTPDEEDVKATIEQFLIVACNYDLNAMSSMMTNNANVGMTRWQNGKWNTETMLFTDYVEAAKKETNRPYFEPVKEYTIHVSDGQLAFVKADALMHIYGVPTKHNIDYFTLLKENKVWKFINASFTSTAIPKEEMIYDPIIFAKSYAQAWCSQNPDFVALFYTEDGSLSINNGKSSIGRNAIAKDAKAFMNTFPDDMIVAFDKLVETSKGIEFHWTLTGTNTEPHGTGKKVNISGFELWQLDGKGLIKESKGSFDADEYSRQLIYGSDN